MILAFMPGTARSAVATLGAKDERINGRPKVCRCRVRGRGRGCAPPATFLPPSPAWSFLPPSSSPSSQLSSSCPACPPARLPLSEPAAQPKLSPDHPPPPTTFPALPGLTTTVQQPAAVPLARPAVPSHPIPSHPSLRPPSPCCTALPFTCAAQPNSEPSIHPSIDASILPPSLPLCTVVLYCIALAPAHLITLCASVPPPGRTSAAAHIRTSAHTYSAQNKTNGRLDTRGSLVRLKKIPSTF